MFDPAVSIMNHEKNSGARAEETTPFDLYRARSHLPELDGIRGIAVILVISWHLQDPMAGWFSGYLGVTIFFVLSGYLITRLGLAEERSRGWVNIPSFFVRRVFRLMPLYYLALAAYCLMYFGFGWSPERRDALAHALPYYLTYFQECALFMDMGTDQGVPFVHSWSLGIEEKYYLVWPFLAFVAWRGRPSVRLWGTLALAVAMASAPYVLGPQKGRFFFSYSHILIGCFMAFLLDDRRRFVRLSWLGRAPTFWIVLLAFLVTHDSYRYFRSNPVSPFHNAYAVVTALAMASILLGGGMVARVLGHPILVKIGRLSYAMYLVHGFALKMAEKVAPPHTGHHLVTLGTLVLAILISIVIASILSVTVEQPFIKAGRRISDRLKSRARADRGIVVGP